MKNKFITKRVIGCNDKDKFDFKRCCKFCFQSLYSYSLNCSLRTPSVQPLQAISIYATASVELPFVICLFSENIFYLKGSSWQEIFLGHELVSSPDEVGQRTSGHEGRELSRRRGVDLQRKIQSSSLSGETRSTFAGL